MANSVSLSSSTMSNLLALNNTQSLIDLTQNRLSTGKKVNSATDDAMAFFKARAFTDRADDLSTIKSNIENGQNVVQKAVDGLDTVATFLKNAKAAAQNARAEKDADSRATYVRQVNEMLKQISSTAGDSNFDGINLIKPVLVERGTAAYDAAAQKVTADIVTAEYREDAVSKSQVNKILDQYVGKNTGTAGTGADIDFQTPLGLDADAPVVLAAVGSSGIITGDAAYNDLEKGDLVKRDDGYYIVTTAYVAGTPGTSNVVTKIDVDATLDTATTGIRATVDVASTKHKPAYDALYQQRINEEVFNNKEIYRDMKGFQNTEALAVVFSEQDKDRKVEVNGSPLNHLLSQLVGRVVTGAEWTLGDTVDTDAIDKFTDLIDTAMDKVRDQSSEFGNYNTILGNRKSFTESMVNTLKGGAANLVNMNQNEESANMLSLQTRQQLGVIALSIAQQSEQAVLRLF